MFVILIAVILVLLFITLQQKTRRYPPGPFPWPLIGNIFYLRKLTQKLGGQHYAYMELCKRYNSDIIMLRLGTNNVIVISNSKLIHEILSKNEYDGRPWNEFIKMRNMGLKKGITMNDGENWKKLRTWSVHTLRDIGFAKQKMIDLLMNELTHILEKINDGGVMRIRSVIAPTTINVLWILLTSKSIEENIKLYLLDLLDRRTQAFDIAGGNISVFPWLRYIAPNFIGYNILVALNNELKTIFMNIINQRKQQYIEGVKTDFIDYFLHEMFAEQNQNSVNSVFTDEDLFITMVDFFIAGSNNTTTTLDFLFLEMANHQNIQYKVHEEIDLVLGTNKPTLQDRKRMPFTEAVLTECQRIWLVTPIVGPRRVLSNTILANYTIPKNITVLMNVYSNNMNEELYPDPTSFKPERFFKNGVYHSDENIILFGKGKRRCPGEVLAKSFIFILFVGIMQKYRLLPVPGKDSINVEITAGVSISPKPYEMLVMPR